MSPSFPQGLVSTLLPVHPRPDKSRGRGESPRESGSRYAAPAVATVVDPPSHPVVGRVAQPAEHGCYAWPCPAAGGPGHKASGHVRAGHGSHSHVSWPPPPPLPASPRPLRTTTTLCPDPTTGSSCGRAAAAGGRESGTCVLTVNCSKRGGRQAAQQRKGLLVNVEKKSKLYISVEILYPVPNYPIVGHWTCRV